MKTLLAIEAVLLLVGLFFWLRARRRALAEHIARNEAAMNCPHGIRKHKKCRGCAEDFVREVEAERVGKVWEREASPLIVTEGFFGPSPSSRRDREFQERLDTLSLDAIKQGAMLPLRTRCFTLSEETPPAEQLRLLIDWWEKTGAMSKERGPSLNVYRPLNHVTLTVQLKIDPKNPKEGMST
jgi:hypothetical protein